MNNCLAPWSGALFFVRKGMVKILLVIREPSAENLSAFLDRFMDLNVNLIWVVGENASEVHDKLDEMIIDRADPKLNPVTNFSVSETVEEIWEYCLDWVPSGQAILVEI